MEHKDTDVRYTFALKWSPDEQDYNIHGLWIELKPGEKETLKAKEFNPDMLLGNHRLLKSLELNWNSDLHKQNADTNELVKADLHFWKHEWDRHGTWTKWNETEFFTKSLELYYSKKPTLPHSNLDHQLHFYFDENLNEIDKKVVY